MYDVFLKLNTCENVVVIIKFEHSGFAYKDYVNNLCSQIKYESEFL